MPNPTIIPFQKHGPQGGFNHWSLSTLAAAKSALIKHHPLGLIGHVLDPERYKALYTRGDVHPLPFKVPIMPAGPRLMADDDATQAATAVTAEKNKQRDKQIEEYQFFQEAVGNLKDSMLASVPEEIRSHTDIFNHETGHEMTTCASIYALMKLKHGTPTIAQVEKNAAIWTSPYKTTTTAEKLIHEYRNAFATAARDHSNIQSEFIKVHALKRAFAHAPAHFQEAIKDFDKSATTPSLQLFDHLAAFLVSAEERTSSELAGATGFGGAAAREEMDAANAAAATRDESAKPHSELDRLTALLAKANLEIATLKRTEDRICTDCKKTFKPRNDRFTQCAPCFIKQRDMMKSGTKGGRAEAGAAKKG
jgi:hypothetical protein